jgi:hypothetical protein
MAGEAVITNNKAVNKDAPKSIALRLKKSGVFFCSIVIPTFREFLKRRSPHGQGERLERLNGVKRLNDWNIWSEIRFRSWLAASIFS